MNSNKNMVVMLFLLVCAGCVEETYFDPSKELPPSKAKALADTIQNFTPNDKNKLIEIADKINEMPPFKKLIDYMSNTLDARFSLIIIDPDRFQGLAANLEAICEYYHSSRIGQFYIKEKLDERNFMHEYFHFFQYVIEDSEASNANRGMMEVERMIAIDIMSSVISSQNSFYFWETNLTNQVLGREDIDYLNNQTWAQEYNDLIEAIRNSKKSPSFSDINISDKDSTRLRTFAKGYGEYMKSSNNYKNTEYAKYNYTVDYHFNASQKLLELLK